MEFSTFTSSIKPSFWIKYTELKLDVDKLNENDRNIWGYYTNVKTLPKSILEVDSTSFNSELTVPNTYLPSYGVLINKNTIEEFKDCSKTQIIADHGEKLFALIENGDATKNPTLLNTFFILTYVDLKKYQYYYWFAFPTPTVSYELVETSKVSQHFDNDQLNAIVEAINKLELLQRSFFVIATTDTVIKAYTFSEYVCLADRDALEIYFVIPDSSTNEKPTWALRNYLLLLLKHFNNESIKENLNKEVNVLALRFSRENRAYHCNDSIVYRIRLPEVKDMKFDSSWIGWERNERLKLGPRMVNMKDSMDPQCLMESAVDLNLKLMKWRLLPDIDLQVIKNTKCLLLGSGTLGCAVARNLMGWGVRKITFVDNSNVSYSNPVRQCLFTYEDCTNKSPKSETAARRLKEIFPGVDSVGYQLNIPMPGHPIGESIMQQTRETVDKLTALIAEHDVIFLLMDSRESRWLPTLLGNHMKKIVINAALGFDTYLVMRHGYHAENPPTEGSISQGPSELKVINGWDLGCYFCNDITAPGNSLKDRTLDQQCTVTRPGVSYVAASLAVELLITVLQHEKGIDAPAYYQTIASKDKEIPSESLLGVVPHSIRGFLSTFTQVLPATKKYNQCTACSPHIMEAYERKRFDFLLEAFNDSKHLEDLTGLSEINEKDIVIWELSDDDEEEGAN